MRRIYSYIYGEMSFTHCLPLPQVYGGDRANSSAPEDHPSETLSGPLKLA
jgi:hypothetical protein